LGVSEVSRVAVIAPRHKADELVEKLMEFEDFHPVEKPRYRDAVLHELEHRAEAGYTLLQSIIKDLGVRDSVGLLDQLFKREELSQMTITADGLKQLLATLEKEAKPITENIVSLIDERKKAIDRLTELREILSGLKGLDFFSLDINEVKRFKRFYFFAGLGSGGEVAEARRALPTAAIIDQPLEGATLIVVVAKKNESENVDRVLKGLGIKPLNIPAQYPQNVKEAVKVIRDELVSVERRVSEIDGNLRKLIAEKSQTIVSLRDGFALVLESLERIAGAGDLKSFAVAEGFIPTEKLEEFRVKIGSCFPVLTVEDHSHNAPTIMRNSSVVKPFEKITAIQGQPSKADVDPTPFVSLFFSIFYGIMFADLGQGLVILAFSLFMYRRVSGDLREWAKLLALLGLASAATGFLIGEAFGFKVGKLLGSPELLHLVEEHGEAKQFSIAEVQRLLVFTLLLGAVHTVTGYALSIIKYLRENEKGEAFFIKLPTLAMYVFGILFALAFFGAGGSIQNVIVSKNPAPMINLPTNLVGSIGIYGALACIIVLMLGRFAAGVIGLGHRAGIVSSVGAGLLEVLENIIHFLSNTISYSRLTILLIVHTALLLLLNTAWEALGLVSLPLLIIGNIGIMLLEGMLVFIQAMRLHVYEFFSKFYDGNGTPFKKLSRETIFTKITFS